MTIDSTPTVKNVLDLKEFLALIKSSEVISHINKRIYIEEEINQVAEWLYSYAANKEEIISFICSDLRDPTQFQKENDMQAPTYLIYKDKRISIRMVVWLPLKNQFDFVPLPYGKAHDHDFDFWTVNFFGNGYKTSLYDYNDNDINGTEGESVTLNFSGDRMLSSTGNVMFYRRNKDVHIQYPPKDFCVSLNLIVQPETKVSQNKLILDSEEKPTENQQVIAHIKKGRKESYHAQESLFHGLLKLGNEKSHQLALQVARNHSRDEIRAIAFEAILDTAERSYNKDDISDLIGLVNNDKSSYVRTRVKEKIKTILSK
ncbi:hypothetical protein [Xenorhabdus anantnagensis]|uniref:HEAT repeat domain-containing protein n=1 Tax=Xenorhabdus anantnagensis TaxID=3025875 RepID=A0ABT5LQT3_9GAMM|nr:hypothetical protein [Xenorhabdus anantnagensis]MDC9596773.1 hypothetical protein [Xenorhabdus anantnagensis]